MAENTVLEGLALRRAVAEALGGTMKDVGDGYWKYTQPKRNSALVRGNSEDEAWGMLIDKYYLLAYDIDLNTLKDAAAMLPDTHKLEVAWYPDETIAIVDVVGSIRWRVNRITVSHTEPATAAWNAVLRWKARKQEAESVK